MQSLNKLHVQKYYKANPTRLIEYAIEMIELKLDAKKLTEC